MSVFVIKRHFISLYVCPSTLFVLLWRLLAFDLGRSMSEKVRRTTATYKQYPHWAKGPAKVEGGHVVLDEGRAQPYYIYEDDGLLFDLLDLHRPQTLDANEVVTFVRRHGLLYHGDDELGSGECREPLDQWHDDLAYLNLAAGVYMDLLEATKSASTQTLRSKLSQVFTYNGPEPSDKVYLEAASVLLGELITAGMQDTKAGLVSTCRLDVQPSSPTTFLLTQLPPNLLAAAYSQFAFLIANKVPVLTCPGCGRLFPRQSVKQIYCTKSCASTSRWRRWNERQGNGTEE
jgi:hypothetical protein